MASKNATKAFLIISCTNVWTVNLEIQCKARLTLLHCIGYYPQSIDLWEEAMIVQKCDIVGI